MSNIYFPTFSQKLRGGFKTQQLFDIWMHCAAVHYRVLEGRDIQGLKDIISSHSQVIRLLNEEMQDPTRACSDENILAVLGMASYG